jgi:hypothetical protein
LKQIALDIAIERGMNIRACATFMFGFEVELIVGAVTLASIATAPSRRTA